MRKPHPSYEMFVAEQRPKYGQTFIEWYSENSQISGVSTIDLIHKTPYELYETSSYFKDPFSKKLIICNTIFKGLVSINDFGGHPIMQYGIDQVADIMDMYEDIIYLIVEKSNIGVTSMPTGLLSKERTFSVELNSFDTIEQLKSFFENGLIIIYNFVIREDGTINMRSFKHEVITREVLFEKF